MKNLFCLFALCFAALQANASVLPQLLGVQNTTNATVFVQKGDDFKIEVFTDNKESCTVKAELVGGLIVLSELSDNAVSMIKITMPRLIHAENRNTGNIITSEDFMQEVQQQMVVINRGKGDIKLHTLSEKLMVCNTGSGQINISGKSDLLESHCIGTGKIKFNEFSTRSAKTHSKNDVASLTKNKASFELPLLGLDTAISVK